MSIKTRLVLPSAYNTINSNRSMGYTMESAVADIIDNSISAKATRIDIIIPPVQNDEQKSISICDNGCGMSLYELDNAMTFGGRDSWENRERDDLGRYGLGLKTASLSQCRQLSVVSKKEGIICGGKWDLDYVKQTNKWEYIELTPIECDCIIAGTPVENYHNGTIVFWKDFDRIRESSKHFAMEFNKQLSATHDHLELIFHRYLTGEDDLTKLSIFINDVMLIPNDPFLTKRIPTVVEETKISIGGDYITVRPHKLLYSTKLSENELTRLQVKGPLLQTQGFYIYRNKRLLIWGTWFGLAYKTDKTKLCRIQVDIPNSLDSLWSLDIKKSMAIPPESIRETLKKIVENVSNISIRTFRTRARTKKDVIPYWIRLQLPDGTFSYEINNDNPLLKNLETTLNEKQKLEFNTLIKELSIFLPIMQVQVDLQNGVIISNEKEADCPTKDDVLKKYQLLKDAGISEGDLLKMEPFCNNLQLFTKEANENEK
ncbi:MAG: ATP-binding protein [Bacteroidales bacterium]|nr:ATP-binding protein [Bacteroidales bacterium]